MSFPTSTCFEGMIVIRVSTGTVKKLEINFQATIGIDTSFRIKCDMWVS